MKTLSMTCFFLFFLTHSIFGQNKVVGREFEELFIDLFADDEPGGSVLVMKGNEVKFLGNYGLSDLGTGDRITENTVFNTGSISKTFVSNAILILHERGQLSIKDSISKYFNDFDSPAIAQSITIEHLLSHTSGLPDIRNVSSNRDFFLSAKDKENWEPIKKTHRTDFTPGSKFEYSNPAFNGLALIIEKVTGEKWQTFIKREIFKAAGMELSTITDGLYPEQGVAHGYIFQNGKFLESDYGEVPTFAAAGNGGIWSTVMELALYEKALLSQEILSKVLLRQSREPFYPSTWTSNKSPTIGYSWFIDVDSRFGNNMQNEKIVYHTGSQGGFRSFYISIPEKEILYIALFNRPFKEYQKVMEEGLQILKSANWLDE